jgi:hypothetical protein
MDSENSFDTWPLVLDINYNFKPVNLNGKIIMKGGEKFIASCPGSKKINGLQTYFGTFECVDKEIIKSDGSISEINFYTLKCEKVRC